MLVKKTYILTIALLAVLAAGNAFFLFENYHAQQATADDLRLDDQEATIRAIKKVKPAVVSIVTYDYSSEFTITTPSGETKTQRKRIEKMRGSGFLISADGYILTNRHVVNKVGEKTGEYRVLLNNGKEYYAQLIDTDSALDLAVLKIFDKNLPFVELGDSNALAEGTTVIAIGNALGIYANSVTKGIVSGLGRSLVASDGGTEEQLDNVIQTDATINLGNSGGPLIDLQGRVIGVNTAVEQSGTDIGFAIPVNEVRPVIKSILEYGIIYRPRIGVYYVMLDEEIAKEKNAGRTNGALITRGTATDTPAIVPGSPAEKAGLLEGDIILEVNAIKLDAINTLAAVIRRYRPGDKIGLRIQRGDTVMIKVVELEKSR